MAQRGSGTAVGYSAALIAGVIAWTERQDMGRERSHSEWAASLKAFLKTHKVQPRPKGTT